MRITIFEKGTSPVAVTFVEPKVTLIAETGTHDDVISRLMELDDSSAFSEGQNLIEFAGRSCYQSFDKPNPATRSNADYLEKTLYQNGHWSIAEHVSATFYLEGVSRAFTHELIRHRHLSYSQMSQRFVNEENANFVIPPALRGHDEWVKKLAEMDESALHCYTAMVEFLQSPAGGKHPRKEAREAARSILPNNIETKIVVTGDLRAWKEMLARRTQPDADAEMQEVAGMIYDALSGSYPAVFPEKN